MDKRITLYPDTTHNENFITKLTEILNRKDSSIEECVLTKNTSDSYCIFIDSKSKRESNRRSSFSSATFNFSHEFTKKEKGDKNFYKEFEETGLSKKDIDSLYDLFNQYTFKNYYESLFFGSKFFKEKEPYKARIYLKYTENPEFNKHLMEGHKIEKAYSLINTESLIDTLEHVKEITVLTPGRFYGLNEFPTEKEILKNYEQRKYNLGEDMLVVEIGKDLETLKTYLLNVYAIKDGVLVKEDANNYMDK